MSVQTNDPPGGASNVKYWSL